MNPSFGNLWTSCGVALFAPFAQQQLLFSKVEGTLRWAVPSFSTMRWYQTLFGKSTTLRSTPESASSPSSSPVSDHPSLTQTHQKSWIRRLVIGSPHPLSFTQHGTSPPRFKLDANKGVVVSKWIYNFKDESSVLSLSYVQELGNKIFVGCSLSQELRPDTSSTVPAMVAVPPRSSGFKISAAAMGIIDYIDSLLHLQVNVNRRTSKMSFDWKLEKKFHPSGSVFASCSIIHRYNTLHPSTPDIKVGVGVVLSTSSMIP